MKRTAKLTIDMGNYMGGKGGWCLRVLEDEDDGRRRVLVEVDLTHSEVGRMLSGRDVEAEGTLYNKEEE
jgi:hypothetical protein